MKHPDYPGISSKTDRHGKERWRFRKNGSDVQLPGEPHSPEFDRAYFAIAEGRPKATPVEGRRLELKSQRNYSSVTERLLRHRIGAGVFGDAPVADLRRRDVIAVLGDFADGATTEWRLLIVLRKL